MSIMWKNILCDDSCPGITDSQGHMSLIVFFLLQRRHCAPSAQLILSTMPSPQVLQPVLQMKVDELFLNWLSDPATQSLLKDYLDLIKSGQYIEIGDGDTVVNRSLSFKDNNNVVSQRNLAEKKPAAHSSPTSSPSSTTIPSGSSSHTRATGLHGRVLRKSVSTKKVIYLSKHRLLYKIINV